MARQKYLIGIAMVSNKFDPILITCQAGAFQITGVKVSNYICCIDTYYLHLHFISYNFAIDQ